MLRAGLSAATSRIDALQASREAEKGWKRNLHIPALAVYPKLEGPFMAYSTCRTTDFLHPDVERLSARLGLEPIYHRKYWEWVFFLHHALRTGAVGPGRRVLGFAVGAEPLPSAFAAAGASVIATDAPEEIGVTKGWMKSGQYASALLDLHKPAVIGREASSSASRSSNATCWRSPRSCATTISAGRPAPSSISAASGTVDTPPYEAPPRHQASPDGPRDHLRGPRHHARKLMPLRKAAVAGWMRRGRPGSAAGGRCT